MSVSQWYTTWDKMTIKQTIKNYRFLRYKLTLHNILWMDWSDQFGVCLAMDNFIMG